MNTSTKFPPAQPLSLAAPEIHAVPDDGTAWINIYRILLRRSALIGWLILLICLLALPAILATHKVYYAGMRVLASPAPALSLTAGLDGRQVSFDLNSESRMPSSASSIWTRERNSTARWNHRTGCSIAWQSPCGRR